MKKLLFAMLIIGLALPACEKDDDLTPNKTEDTTGGGNNGGSDPVQLSKLDMITQHVWVLKSAVFNGNQVITNGSDEYEWLRDGTHRTLRDANGNWGSQGSYNFVDQDSAAFTMYTGAINQQYWQLKKLTNDTMKIDFLSNNGMFNFTFLPL